MTARLQAKPAGSFRALRLTLTKVDAVVAPTCATASEKALHWTKASRIGFQWTRRAPAPDFADGNGRSAYALARIFGGNVELKKSFSRGYASPCEDATSGTFRDVETLVLLVDEATALNIVGHQRLTGTPRARLLGVLARNEAVYAHSLAQTGQDHSEPLD